MVYNIFFFQGSGRATRMRAALEQLRHLQPVFVKLKGIWQQK